MDELFFKGTWQRLRFEVERLLVRGAHYRFLFVAALIGFVSILGGLAVQGSSDDPLWTEVWWAFLRLSDPGYLGDDEGTWRRIVSTTLTVLGYVLFMGAMVAILTQWLNEALTRFSMGLTPVRMTGHVAILGWTGSTRAVCRNLVRSERRLSRWLTLQGVSSLQIAILAEEIGPERVAELRESLGEDYRRNQIVLRSGSPLFVRHLRRVDLANAACVVIPAMEGTSARAEGYDAAVIKTLRLMNTLDAQTEDLPTVVCELLDPRRLPLAARAYRGPLEVVASDVLVGRLLAASTRQPGVADVCFELLTHGEGATLYVLDADRTQSIAEARTRLGSSALLLGLIDDDRPDACVIAPSDSDTIDEGDGVIIIARDHPEWQAARPARPDHAPVTLPDRDATPSSVLILGWSRRVPDLLAELGQDGRKWAATCMSTVPVEKRQYEPNPGEPVLDHRVGDPTVPSDLRRANPLSFDRIVVVASEWVRTGEEADARAITTYLALEDVAQGAALPGAIVIELLSRASEQMFDSSRVEVVVSPQLVSHALAQVVLRRGLRGVIDQLFGSGTGQVQFIKPTLHKPTTFGELEVGLRGQPRVAIGVRRGGLGGALLLAPEAGEILDPEAADELVVIERDGG